MANIKVDPTTTNKNAMQKFETGLSRSKSEEELQHEQLRAQIGDAIKSIDSMEAGNKEYPQDPLYNEAIGKLKDLAKQAVQQNLAIKFNQSEFGGRKSGIVSELSDDAKAVVKEAGFDPDAPDFIGVDPDRLQARLEEKGYVFMAEGNTRDLYFLRPQEKSLRIDGLVNRQHTRGSPAKGMNPPFLLRQASVQMIRSSVSFGHLTI